MPFHSGSFSKESLFRPTRNAPDAWGSINISAGWVSDVDFFRTVHTSRNSSARHTFRDRLKYKRVDYPCTLNLVLSEAVKSKESQLENSDPSSRDTYKSVPLFTSDITQVDHCDPDIMRNVVQVVQEEGDLIIVPPRWWHQVYHLEPSIAVASQYMNEVVKEGVIDHMLKWSNVKSVDIFADDVSLEASDQGRYNDSEISGTSQITRDQIKRTIRTCLVAQHGKDKGLVMFNDLYS